MKKLHFLVILIPIVFACTEEGIDPNISDFDRQPILRHTADSLIIPSYLNLNNSINDFKNDLQSAGDTLSIEEIENLRLKWQSTTLNWKKAEVFNFGPISDLNLHSSIGTWPVNSFAIDNTLMDQNALIDFDINTLTDNQKGLATIEYILFNKDVDELLADFNTNSNRRKYIELILIDLENSINTVYNSWVSEGGNYRQVFIENDGNDVGSSMTFLANNMIILQELVKNFKVATPLGLRSGGLKDPELVESPYARISIQQMEANLEMIEEIFTGGENDGFDVYLDAVNAQGDSGKLSDEIKSQFRAIDAAINEIDGDLKSAIESDEQDVMDAFIEMQKLTTLLKTDMMSSLGLLVTFSDNDGD